jgi:ABC-type Fe3+-hydroxamate transport system substrate-binding protein
MNNQDSNANHGNGHYHRVLHFDRPPQRVVSLVPSLTESLFELGLGEALVGVTDYCIHPAQQVAQLPHVGSVKEPRLAEIIALQPDLVLANWEENQLETVEALEAAGIGVWITMPTSVRESLDVLWKLVELFRSQAASLRMQTLELTLDWAASAAGERNSVSYFCPIWYETLPDGRPSWWMTFNRQTYCHDLLSLIGGQNIFAERKRRYPLAADLGLQAPEDAGKRDTRYPHVTLDEVIAARPELILLPDEPFIFGETHRQQYLELFADTPAARQKRILLVDGTLITWAGTRLARALRDLPALLDLAY